MRKLEFRFRENKVIVTDVVQDKDMAEISYDREVVFYSYIRLWAEEINSIRRFARYDNVPCSIEQPYEKALKPVKYRPDQWKAVTRIIDEVTGHSSLYEYDEAHGDIYVRSNKRICRNLCDFLTRNKIQHSLQADQQNYCTVIYSNLINQIEQLDRSLLSWNKNAPGYQTVRFTFNQPLAEINHIFDDTEKWGVASLKEWVDCYESSRFTQISSRRAIITSEYNMEFVKEWLMKMNVVKTIRKLR